MSEYISLENEDYESAHWGTQAKRQGGSDLEERRAASECVPQSFPPRLRERISTPPPSLLPSLAFPFFNGKVILTQYGLARLNAPMVKKNPWHIDLPTSSV